MKKIDPKSIGFVSLTLLLSLLLIACSCSMVNAQAVQWAKKQGGSGFAITKLVDTDPSGNVYYCGLFVDTLDADPGPNVFSLTGNGLNDVYVGKYDAAGNFLWARKFGSIYNENVFSMEVDSSGNIILTGLFRGTVDFDPGPNTFNLSSGLIQSNIFMCKLNMNGLFVWARAFDTDQTALVQLYNGGSDIWLAGTYSDSLDLDPGVNTDMHFAGPQEKAYFLKFDAGGNLSAVKELGDGLSSISVTAYTVDRNGNQAIAGMMSGTLDADMGPGQYLLNANGYNIGYFIRYDSMFNFHWAGNFPQTVYPYRICTDSNDNTFIGGSFSNGGDFDPGLGIFYLSQGGNPNTSDVFLLKLNTTGSFVWAHKIGGSSEDYFHGLDLGKDGAVYLTGNYQGTVDMNPGAAANTLSGYGVFVTKWSNDGDYHWAKGYSRESADLHNDPSGQVIVCGYFQNTVNFDTIALSAQGYDGFIIRLNACHLIDTGIQQTGVMLTANATQAAYQWVRCNPYQLLPDETGQSYAAAGNGDYACIITQNGCSDTSACITVNGLWTGAVSAEAQLPVYPNPSAGRIYVATAAEGERTFQLCDVTGTLLYEALLGSGQTMLDLPQADGIYFYRIRARNQYTVTGKLLIRKP